MQIRLNVQLGLLQCAQKHFAFLLFPLQKHTVHTCKPFTILQCHKSYWLVCSICVFALKLHIDYIGRRKVWGTDPPLIWTQCIVSICKQLNVEWNKAVRRTLNLPYKTHRRLLPLIVNGKSFKSQHCSRLHKYIYMDFFLLKISMFLSLVLKLKRGWRDHWGVTGPAWLSWTALFHSTLRMSIR